jgi:hypothetical protein
MACVISLDSVAMYALYSVVELAEGWELDGNRGARLDVFRSAWSIIAGIAGGAGRSSLFFAVRPANEVFGCD